MINKKIKQYIEENIFPSYDKNDQGHNLEHIKYVIRRSIKFAKPIPNINMNMVYVIAAYHDIGHYIDAKNHEKVSSEMLLKDEKLKEFFTEEEIRITADAVYDHRASMEGDPRTIYGKIVSSADRNNTVKKCLYRSYFYGKKLDPKASDPELYERAYNVLKKKFGEGGYAKFYFEDNEYNKFLISIRKLLSNKDKFIKTQKRYIESLGEYVFTENMLCKHFKGKELIDKNIYRIISLKNKGIDIPNNIKYTGEKDILKSNDLVIYQNIFNKLLFTRELDDFYKKLSKDKQKEYKQMHRVEPLNDEEIKEVNSNKFIIEKSLSLINPKLKEYIEENIFPSYDRNEIGHGIDHIKYVIERSFIFANRENDINLDMVYVIAAYHDIGHYIDAKNHEKISSEMLLKDEKLKEFFTEEEIKIMADAVYDHRSSMKEDPRTKYGKIVSSADRNVIIEIPLQRSYSYRIEHGVGGTMEDVIEESRQHLIDKFGNKGYATTKMYYDDPDYKMFLEELPKLTSNKEEFKRRFIKANKLDNKLKYTFDEVKRLNKELSLDQVLYKTYEELNDERPFDIVRKKNTRGSKY